ncbi:MAG: hypothetical protein ACTSVY_04850, partial [Candidatus Helarchaeota archaeon]
LVEFSTQFTNGAQEIMYNLMDRMNILFSKSLEDLSFLFEVALYAIIGKDYYEFYEQPVYHPAETTEEGVAKITIGIRKCVMCSTIENKEDVDPDKLGDRNYGEIMAMAFTVLLQEIQNYVENDYKIVGKETKCYLRGDDKGEYTFYFYPKE